MTYLFPIAACYQITWNCNSLTQSHRAACQRHERSFTHNNNPSKSALTGLWVITVLSLECFVFRFACSVSKANNHSLFTVWVGLFFLQQGKLHTRVTALREREDQQPRQALVSAVLNQGGRDADYSLAVCWLCGKGSKGLETWIYCTLTVPTINCLPQHEDSMIYCSNIHDQHFSTIYPLLQELLFQTQRRLSYI